MSRDPGISRDCDQFYPVIPGYGKASEILNPSYFKHLKQVIVLTEILSTKNLGKQIYGTRTNISRQLPP